MEAIRLDRERLEEAAGTLSAAFEEDPILNFFFPPSDPQQMEKMKALFRFSGHTRLRMDDPFLGVIEDGQVVGAATLRSPGNIVRPDDLKADWEKVEKEIGEGACARLEQYHAVQERHELAEPMHYLVSIGVHPNWQGRGVGKALINRVIKYADDDPMSHGVALDTDSLANVKLYEHFGFKVYAENQIEGRPFWIMIRRS